MCQALRSHRNQILFIWLLKDSPRTEPMNNEEDTKKVNIFYFQKLYHFYVTKSTKQVVTAPSRTKGFKSLLIPSIQLPNIFDTLQGLATPNT